MGSENVVAHSTRGSAFARIANYSRDKRLERVLLDHNMGNWVKGQDGKNLFFKESGWSLPGGKHRVYPKDILVKLNLPTNCCETPQETLLREVFEESNIILRTEDEKIGDCLRGLAEEIINREQSTTYLEMASRAYIVAVHNYAQMAQQHLEDISLSDELKKESWVRTYAFPTNAIVDLDCISTKNDLAKNTDKLEWFTVEKLEDYIQTLRKLYLGEFGRVEKTKDFMESKDGPGYWIYYSTLRRLGFRDADWRPQV